MCDIGDIHVTRYSFENRLFSRPSKTSTANRKKAVQKEFIEILNAESTISGGTGMKTLIHLYITRFLPYSYISYLHYT